MSYARFEQWIRRPIWKQVATGLIKPICSQARFHFSTESADGLKTRQQFDNLPSAYSEHQPRRFWKVALLGRPNVGKSSLYNLLLSTTKMDFVRGRRKQHVAAIVSHQAGSTKDRKEGCCQWGRLHLKIVDTGGIEDEALLNDSVFLRAVKSNAMMAADDADVVLFIFDVTKGFTPLDAVVGQMILDRIHRKCRINEVDLTGSLGYTEAVPSSPAFIFIGNKADNIEDVYDCIGEAYEADIGHPMFVSARTCQGMDELYEKILAEIKLRKKVIYTPHEDNEEGDFPGSYSSPDLENCRKPVSSEVATRWLHGLARRYGGLNVSDNWSVPTTGSDPYLPWLLESAHSLPSLSNCSDCEAKEIIEMEEQTEESAQSVPQVDPQHLDIGTEAYQSFRVPKLDVLQHDDITETFDTIQLPFPNAPQKIAQEKPMRIAFIGRPNAGKSSMINAILNEYRIIVDDCPGTTTDAIGVDFKFKNRMLRLIDTAGVTRGWKMRGSDLRVESGLQTLKNIRMSDICVLCIDASYVDANGIISSNDLSLANLATVKEGCGLVVCITKWDTIEASKEAELRENIVEKVKLGLGHLKGCPVIFSSSTNRRNITVLLNKVIQMHKRWSSRVSTGKLNDWLQRFMLNWPPPWRLGAKCHVKYMSQIATCPPTFVAVTNVYLKFPENYKRQLINKLREELLLEGVPVKLILRSTAMPKPGVKLTKEEVFKWKRLGPRQMFGLQKVNKKFQISKHHPKK